MPDRSRITAAAIAATLALGLAGCAVVDIPLAPSSSANQAASTQAPTANLAQAPSAAKTQALLDSLPVKGRAPMTGYDRTGKFGSAWKDVDRNGCDTRNDILARDLTDIRRDADCRVLSGTLNDPYTGTTIAFTRGEDTSPLVQIDHVVALADAWQKGAQGWSQTKRVSFANDPKNLLAVDGEANQAKSAGDAATWLPKNKAYRCTYVTKQVEVKADYGLWVTQAEHDAIARILASCPS